MLKSLMFYTTMAILVFPTTLIASSKDSIQKESIQLCTNLADMAWQIMDARQKGVPMNKIFEVASSGTEIDKLTQMIIIEAYESPKYSSQSYKNDAINDFRDAKFLMCIKARMKKQ